MCESSLFLILVCVCVQWFTKAGFTDVKIKQIGPSWYRGVRRHGLIMGCSVTGTKAQVSYAVDGGTMMRSPNIRGRVRRLDLMGCSVSGTKTQVS